MNMLFSRPAAWRVIVIVLLALHPGVLSAQTRNEVEPRGNYATVNGKRLWYRIEGRGEPIVLVPGGPGSSHDYFWPPFSALADSFTVVYFDAYGRGQSQKAVSPAEYTFEREINEVEGLRLALGLGKINLLGHSYGGIVAQAYALAYPNSLRRLILSNTLHSAEMWQDGNNGTCNFELRNQFPEIWEQLQELRKEGKLSCDSAYAAIQGKVPSALWYYYDPTYARDKTYGESKMEMAVYCQLAGPDADVHLGGELARFDVRQRLVEIEVPTLIIAGRFDRVSVPRYSIQYKYLMPQATFVMFEKSGHNPYVEERDAYFRILRRFLKQGEQ